MVINIVINMHARGFYEKKRSSSVNKKMITEEKLSTQKEIQDRLEEHNVCVTQTILSHDLREIGLTKVKKNDMVYYVIVNETEKIDLVNFVPSFRRCRKSRVYFGVAKKIDGEASVLANIADANKDEWILGTVAGTNTSLVNCQDQHVAKLMEDRLLDLMKDK